MAFAKGFDRADVEVAQDGCALRFDGGDFVLREVLRIDDDGVVGREGGGVFGVEADEDGIGVPGCSGIGCAAECEKQNETTE